MFFFLCISSSFITKFDIFVLPFKNVLFSFMHIFFFFYHRIPCFYIYPSKIVSCLSIHICFLYPKKSLFLCFNIQNYFYFRCIFPPQNFLFILFNIWKYFLFFFMHICFLYHKIPFFFFFTAQRSFGALFLLSMHISFTLSRDPYILIYIQQYFLVFYAEFFL